MQKAFLTTRVDVLKKISDFFCECLKSGLCEKIEISGCNETRLRVKMEIVDQNILSETLSILCKHFCTYNISWKKGILALYIEE